MASVVSKVMTTVNAPYGVAVSPAELAARLADPESASVCDHAAFAFLSEVAPQLQHQFIDEMGIDAGKVALVASRFSEMAGFRLALAT